MTALPDLCTSDRQQWLLVLARLLELAEQDHTDGRLTRRTASGLRLEVGKMRTSHSRLLTTVYNHFRDELITQDRPRARQEGTR